jgi:hypothetical protein
MSDPLTSQPRWAQAEDLTGGDPRRQSLLDRLPGGSVLDHIAGGSVLDPPPRRKRQPLLRCDRCGCLAPKGYAGRICPVCCGGGHPTPTIGTGISGP